MIYRLIVNAAFLAVGYYIGREVGRSMAAEPPASTETRDGAERATGDPERREDTPQGDA